MKTDSYTFISFQLFCLASGSFQNRFYSFSLDFIVSKCLLLVLLMLVLVFLIPNVMRAYVRGTI